MLKEKVEKVLDEIRPFLQSEGGNVELVEVTEAGLIFDLSRLALPSLA